MAGNTHKASVGYFNKEMLAILKKGETKTPKKAASKSNSKAKSKK